VRFEVHGIGHDILEPPGPPVPGGVTLRDKPVFARIGQAFLDFIGDAQLVIHNAAFDMKFLNARAGAHWPARPALCARHGHADDCAGTVSRLARLA
jgi:hypothetical protein